MTHEKEQTRSQFEGKGGFNAQPDQNVLGNYKEGSTLRRTAVTHQQSMSEVGMALIAPYPKA